MILFCRVEVHIPLEGAVLATAAVAAPRTRQPAMGTAERRVPVAAAEVEEEVIYLEQSGIKNL